MFLDTLGMSDQTDPWDAMAPNDDSDQEYVPTGADGIDDEDQDFEQQGDDDGDYQDADEGVTSDDDDLINLGDIVLSP